MTFNVLYRTKDSPAVTRGVFEQPSEAILRADLQARGYSVILVQRAEASSWAERLERFQKIRVRFPKWWASADELALLCEVFRALYTSGIQMLQIVRMSIDETPNRWLRKKLVIVLEHLQTGDGLADAMSDPRCKRAFPSLMVESIRVGEENGRLDDSLKRLGDTFKRVASTKRQTFGALLYPGFTLFFFFGVCAFLAIKIPDTLKDFLGPKQIRALRANPEFPHSINELFYLREHWIILVFIPCFFIVLFLLCLYLRRFPTMRYVGTKYIQRKIWGIGKLIAQFSLIRFLELLVSNHESGIAIGDSLRLVRNSVGDAIFERSIDRIHRNILENGYGLSEAMDEEEEREVYPGLVRQMVRAGEESGKFSEMLRPIIDYYDEISKALLKSVLDMLPVITICMLGVVIGRIVIGVYKALIMMQEASVNALVG